VRGIRSIIALVLLAVWLPTTLHCAMESAGWLPPDGCCSSAADEHCEDGPCVALESGFVSSAGNTISVLLKDAHLLGCACQICQHLLALDFSAEVCREIPWNHANASPVWLPSMSFEHRLALPARAPTLV